MAQPFFAYMLRCADGTYYVGHTDDLPRRLAEHREGAQRCYTASRRPLRLVWFETFATRQEALDAEMRVKKWSRAKKDALARGDLVELRREAKKKDWSSHRSRRGEPA